MTQHRIGIDVGGTFTDVVLIDEQLGTLTVSKVLNRERAGSDVVVEAIGQVIELAELSPDAVGWISHGTTITTNAVIERAGAKTALITNEGFRDVLEIGRFSRPAELIYRVHADKPSPLVPRYLRLGVRCRVDRNGQVLTEIDSDALDSVIDTLEEEGVESVAVSFLFSFLEPRHEELVRSRLAARCPDIDVVLSSESLREFREFPRTSTTVFSAYVAPVLRAYLERLLAGLRDHAVHCPLYVFQSNGGIARPDVVMRNPALTLLSGPAGAVIGAAALCGDAGYSDIITMDMGGTSLDVCGIREGVAQVTTGREIDFFPVSLPTIDVQSVGAGGGSVIGVDSVGRVSVGPRSMGAMPGPACYGRGGTEATLTDTNLLMGLLNADYFAGGDLRLDADAARDAVRERVGEPLGVRVEAAALGTYQVATTQAAEAIRATTIERGHDPRDFTLVAFGGGGPLHAAAIAEELGITTVLIPHHPGLFSARGIAVADFTHDYAQSLLVPLSELDHSRIADSFSRLEAQAEADFEAEHIEPAKRQLLYSFDLRYFGQTTEINVEWPSGPLAGDLQTLEERFHAQHEQLYSYSVAGEPIELVNIRLKSIGTVLKPPLRKPESTGRIPEPAAHRTVFFPGLEKGQDLPVYRRDTLAPGAHLAGPAIVEEASSSAVVPTHWQATIDSFDNMVLTYER